MAASYWSEPRMEMVSVHMDTENNNNTSAIGNGVGKVELTESISIGDADQISFEGESFIQLIADR